MATQLPIDAAGFGGFRNYPIISRSIFGVHYLRRLPYSRLITEFRTRQLYFVSPDSQVLNSAPEHKASKRV